ncbi:MAG: LOG family protein [Opitutaceae bacterium]|nr:LOG family protein [Opitutaceae bacterium]
MSPDQFWTSQDGQVLAVRNQNERSVALTLAFWPRHPAEFEFMREQAPYLHFTERSTLARIGIEMSVGVPTIEKGRLVMEATAFLFDEKFPNAPFWKKLLRPGVPVGRLYLAPASAKLSATEIWDALKQNQIKLPNTISIDRLGRVFLTPHQVYYTISPKLPRDGFERLVNGEAGRSYLDKVQIRHDIAPLSIGPRSGLLTSCSMFLKEHYVVLNQGEGNFGIHTSAVLLDPVKTFGTNIMLEIYNQGDQPVVNPMVSVEVFRAPTPQDTGSKSLAKRRTRLYATARDLYEHVGKNPPEETDERPKTKISVRGRSATMENVSMLLNAAQFADLKARKTTPDAYPVSARTMIQALDSASEEADTLVVDFFPNLLEQIELLARLQKLKLRRIIFRKPSRTHGFFLSSAAHGRLDAFNGIGIQVYWYNEQMKDLYLHTYKKGHGFFIREELVKRFQEATILAFYGSAVGLDDEQTRHISTLIEKLSAFIGTNVGVLTGGGGGVMRLATDQAREKGAITGACFLELEAQPPELGVDFFNTFQETSRHFRQKWFEVADFCIFNVGGVGTLEEIGIEMCNLKLGIRPRTPYVFYDARFFADLRKQIRHMVQTKRALAWIMDYILFSDDPDEVVSFYREKLQVL